MIMFKKLKLFRNSIYLFASSALIFSSSLATAREQDYKNRLGTEVYAFLPTVVLDLKRGLELESIRGGRSSISDCSSKTFHCLNGQLFKLAWPKKCTDHIVGISWSNGKITTRVVNRFMKQGHLSGEIIHVAVTDARPDLAYMLSNNGVVAIAYDPTKTGKLSTFVATDEFTKLMQGNILRGKDYVVAQLHSAIPLGRCIPASGV